MQLVACKLLQISCTMGLAIGCMAYTFCLWYNLRKHTYRFHLTTVALDELLKLIHTLSPQPNLLFTVLNSFYQSYVHMLMQAGIPNAVYA